MEISSEYAFPIFISSTDYNLVDLRGELAHHLTELGYRPILSSADGFPDQFPELEPWESCLPVLDSCFVMILVIDGRYGDALDWPHYQNYFNGRKLSPTHGEYLYAHKLRKRMLVFVRSEILTHYQSYRAASAKASGDEQNTRNLLSNTLPSGVAFETLQFVKEVKTCKPIPWVRPFIDVTSIKREIQKKMLNELAEVFLLKNKHFDTVLHAFSRAMDELSPDKRKEVLRSIGVTRELIEEVEKQAKDVQELRNREKQLRADLESASGEIAKGEKSKEEKAALEVKVRRLTEERNQLQRQIEERERTSASYILGSTRSTVGGSGNPLFTTTGSLGLASSPFGDSPSLFGSRTENTCNGCGKHDVTGTLFGFRQCPTCNKDYCISCWPLTDILGRDVCPTCRIGFQP